MTKANKLTPGWSLQDDISGLSELAIRKRAMELNRKRIHKKDKMKNETKNAENHDEEEILSSNEKG